MELSYGQLETTLAQYLRIQPDRIPTLKSRIKQLQRLEFPPGVNVGRGSKMSYTGEHLFQMVTVFELLGFGVPAKTACQIIKRHWGVFAGGFALSVLQERRPSDHENVEDVYGVLHIRTLHEIQFSSLAGDVAPSSLKVRDLSSLQQEFRDFSFKSDYSRWVISLSAIQRRVIDLASNAAGVASSNRYDEEFHSWLPDGAHPEYRFQTYYPDRSNIEMRQELNALTGNDPDALSDIGTQEAVDFVSNDFRWKTPF
jgi:hypothetical protein